MEILLQFGEDIVFARILFYLLKECLSNLRCCIGSQVGYSIGSMKDWNYWDIHLPIPEMGEFATNSQAIWLQTLTLRKLKLQHPTAKMMAELSKAQEGGQTKSSEVVLVASVMQIDIS